MVGSVSAALVVVGWCGAIAFGAKHAADRAAMKAEIGAVEQFLRDLEAHDDDAAYQLLCPSAQPKVVRSDFTAAMEALPRPRSHRIVKTFYLDEAGNDGVVEVRFSDSNDVEHDYTFKTARLGNDAGCVLPFEPRLTPTST
jgi:hypothetical protein